MERPAADPEAADDTCHYFYLRIPPDQEADLPEHSPDGQWVEVKSVLQGRVPLPHGQKDIVAAVNGLYRPPKAGEASAAPDSKRVDLYYNRELTPDEFAVFPVIKEKFLDDHIRLERFTGVTMAVMPGQPPRNPLGYGYDLHSWAGKIREAAGAEAQSASYAKLTPAERNQLAKGKRVTEPEHLGFAIPETDVGANPQS